MQSGLVGRRLKEKVRRSLDRVEMDGRVRRTQVGRQLPLSSAIKEIKESRYVSAYERLSVIPPNLAAGWYNFADSFIYLLCPC